MHEPLFFPLLTGGILLLAGCIQYFFPPKKINGFYGYRTARSMKNDSLWQIAQVYSAKQLIVLGLFLLALAPIANKIEMNENVQVGLFLPLLIAGVIILIIRTEIHLKKQDNEDEK
jgi:uncharacterized membrane protein